MYSRIQFIRRESSASCLTLFRVFSSRNGFTRARVAWTYRGAERKCIALNRAGNRPRRAAIRFRKAAAPNALPCRNENPLQSTTTTKPHCWKKIQVIVQETRDNSNYK